MLTQSLLPLIAVGGRIVSLSCGLARFSYPGRVSYAVMKGAVEALTPYLVVEFGASGIVVSTVVPGAIATDFGVEVFSVSSNTSIADQVAALAHYRSHVLT